MQSFFISIIDYEVSTLLCNCKELLYNYLKKQQSNISRVSMPPRFQVANYICTLYSCYKCSKQGRYKDCGVYVFAFIDINK